MPSSCPYPSHLFYIDPTLPCRKACTKTYRSLESIVPLLAKIPPQETVTIVLYPGILFLKDPIILRHPNLTISALIPGTVDIDGVLEITDELYTTKATTLLTGFQMNSDRCQIRYRFGNMIFLQKHTLRNIRIQGTFPHTLIHVTTTKIAMESSPTIQMQWEQVSIKDIGNEFTFDFPPLVEIMHHVEEPLPFVFQLNGCSLESTVVQRKIMYVQNILSLTLQSVSMSGNPLALLLDCVDIQESISVNDSSFSRTSVTIRSVVSEGRYLSNISFSNVQADVSTFLVIKGSHGRILLVNCLATCTNSVIFQEGIDFSLFFFLIQNCSLYTTQEACVKAQNCLLGIQNSTLTSLFSSIDLDRGTLDVENSFVTIQQSTVTSGNLNAVSVVDSRLDIIGSQLRGGRSALVVNNSRTTISTSTLTGPVGIELTPSDQTLLKVRLESSFFENTETNFLGVGNGEGQIVIDSCSFFGTEVLGEATPESDTEIGVEYEGRKNFSTGAASILEPFYPAKRPKPTRTPASRVSNAIP